MQRIGIVLLLIGLAIFFILGGARFLEFIFSSESTLFLKAAVFSMITGIFLIIFSLLGKKDKYEEVKK